MGSDETFTSRTGIVGDRGWMIAQATIIPFWAGFVRESSRSHVPLSTAASRRIVTSTSVRAGTSKLLIALTPMRRLRVAAVGVHRGIERSCSRKKIRSDSRSIKTFCFFRKSRPSIPSEVRGLATTTSTDIVAPFSARVTEVVPNVWRGDPSAPTSPSAEQGVRGPSETLTRSHTSLRRSVTAAPVSTSSDTASPLTDPSRR